MPAANHHRLAALLAAAAIPLIALVEGGAAVRWALLAPFAASLAALLAPAAARVLARPSRAEAAVLAALAAAAGAALAGLAIALLEGDGALDAGVAAARGLALALAVTVPAGTAALALRRASAAAAEPVAPPAPPATARRRGTTRRGFLQTGAAGSVAVAGLTRVIPAAAAPPEPFRLTITEGDIPMEDGTRVFFRGFRPTSSTVDVPTLPGPAIGNTGPGVKGREVFEGDAVSVVITNSTPRDHTFLIEQTDSETPVNPVVGPVVISGHSTKTINFTAPPAGSYLYRDADRNNRLLGMCGAFIVLPQDVSGRLLPYAPAPDRLEIQTELRAQLSWILSDVDPVLGELARTRRNQSTIDYPLSKVLPRYFLINGETGVNATKNVDFTVPTVPLQVPGGPFVGVLIRCIHTGVAMHSLHWHGNHVFPVERNGVPEKPGLVFEIDALRIEGLQRTDVILPGHTGFDSFPPLNANHPKGAEQHYPMHCHAEMSQTAAGGSYPFGLLTDWHLTLTEADAAQARQALSEQRAAGRKQADPVEVQAALQQVAKENGHDGSGKGKGRGKDGDGNGGGKGKG